MGRSRSGSVFQRICAGLLYKSVMRCERHCSWRVDVFGASQKLTAGPILGCPFSTSWPTILWIGPSEQPWGTCFWPRHCSRWLISYTCVGTFSHTDRLYHRWVQKRCDVRARDWVSAFKLWKLPMMIGGAAGKSCAIEYILRSVNHVSKQT
jgi:hypothetical protein